MIQLRLSSYPHSGPVIPPRQLGKGLQHWVPDPSSFQAGAVLGSQASPSPWVAVPVHRHMNDQTTQGTNKSTIFFLLLGAGEGV